MRVLVCGDRNWTDFETISLLLDGLAYHYASINDPLVVIEGDAKGADRLAGKWTEPKTRLRSASKNGMFQVELEVYPANWTKYGRAAGPIRNRQMLDEGKPDRVYAFHDDLENSKGTRNMVEQALKANLPVINVRSITSSPVVYLGPAPDVKEVREGLQQIADDVGKLF